MYTMSFVTSNHRHTLVLLTPIRCITLYLVLTLHLTSLSRVRPSELSLSTVLRRMQVVRCSFYLLWFKCLHVYSYTYYCPTPMALYGNGNN